MAGGHSGQVSPIESSTSAIATAAFARRPAGGSRRAMAKARSRACGSVRSCIQPCSSHSRMAPTSSNTEIAHPSSVRIAGRRFFVISMLNSLRERIPGRGVGSSIDCPKDSDSFEVEPYIAGRRYLLEFATCPSGRGTWPTGWQSADPTGSCGKLFRSAPRNKHEPKPKPF